MRDSNDEHWRSAAGSGGAANVPDLGCVLYFPGRTGVGGLPQFHMLSL
jgi:hypothetical protein